jgi:hypothetical protein
VERYPDFLPWWIAARIQKREVGVYYTHQVLGLGPIRVSFGSKTMLRRPERIDVISDEPPFRQFRLSWIFESRPLPSGSGCRVSVPFISVGATRRPRPAGCHRRHDGRVRNARSAALRAHGPRPIPWSGQSPVTESPRCHGDRRRTDSGL